jgi:hypothetical protein
LSDVDLREDEQLMASSQAHSSQGQIDPLIASIAQQVLSSFWIVLFVHDQPSSGDTANGDDAEDEIGPEKATSLLLEKLPVVSKSVFADGRHVVKVEIVVPRFHVGIVELVNEHDNSDEDKVDWVDLGRAARHPETCDEKSQRHQMHGQSVDLVDNHGVVFLPIRYLVIG